MTKSNRDVLRESAEEAGYDSFDRYFDALEDFVEDMQDFVSELEQDYEVDEEFFSDLKIRLQNYKSFYFEAGARPDESRSAAHIYGFELDTYELVDSLNKLMDSEGLEDRVEMSEEYRKILSK